MQAASRFTHRFSSETLPLPHAVQRGWADPGAALPEPARHPPRILLPIAAERASEPWLFAEHNSEVKRYGDDCRVEQQPDRAECPRPAEQDKRHRNVHRISRVAIKT